MKRQSRGRSSCVTALALAFVLFFLPGLAWAEESAFEPSGTWYVLVHYVEDGASGWEDKVWTFERRGSRLVWTEYPVLVFRAARGRHVSLASGRSIRSPGHWRPDATQRQEIESGLGVVDRWSRSKTLRGDAAGGYFSRGAVNRDSASVIGYSERWEISGLDAAPRFRRVDQLSADRAVALDGVTQYRATETDTRAMEGVFDRDGLQTGAFRMQRVGPVRRTPGDQDTVR